MRNETSQIPVTGPGTCLALVSIRPGQGTRPDESKASVTRTPDRVRFPPNLDFFFFGSVGFCTTSTSDSVVGLCPFRQRGIWTLDSVDFATAWTFSVEMSGSGCSASGEPTPTTTPSSCSFTSLSRKLIKSKSQWTQRTKQTLYDHDLDSADLQLHAVCLRIREGVRAPFFFDVTLVCDSSPVAFLLVTSASRVTSVWLVLVSFRVFS